MNLLEKIHETYVRNRRVNVLARELTALLPRGRILDIGAGDGLLASLIQKQNKDVTLTGIDVLVRDRSHIPILYFDGTVVPFADDSFDAVMLIDVLHHTEDPTVLLREAARVSREMIVIKDHLTDRFAAESTLLFMDQVGNRRYDVALPNNYWPTHKWFEIFRSLNLKLREWKPAVHLYPRPVDWFFGGSLHFIAQLQVNSFQTGRP